MVPLVLLDFALVSHVMELPKKLFPIRMNNSVNGFMEKTGHILALPPSLCACAYWQSLI